MPRPFRRPALAVEPLEPRDVPANVLLIGNSYTASDPVRLDTLLSEVMVAAGQPAPTVGLIAPGGFRLIDHANAQTPASLAATFPGRQADVVVMQGQSLEAATGYTGTVTLTEFRQGAVALGQDVRAAFPNARLVLLETWARPNPSEPAVYAVYPSQAFMQTDIRDGYADAEADLRAAFGAAVEVAPAGEGFRLAGFTAAIPTGQTGSLYRDAGGHPSFLGELVAALTVYAAAFDDNVSDVPASRAAGLLAARGLTPADWQLATRAADRAVGEQQIDQNRRFVQQVYRDTLGREADAAGLAFWLETLTGGQLSRVALVDSFLASEEYRIKVVRDHYQLYLNRPADPVGQELFVNQLRLGVSVDAVRLGLLSSQEFFNLGGGTNDGFVRRLHDVLLNRPAGDTAFWVNGLTAGASRLEVATGVYNSREGREKQVRELYAALLGRPADPAGLSLFAGSLQAGLPFQQAIRTMLGSQEYYNRWL